MSDSLDNFVVLYCNYYISTGFTHIICNIIRMCLTLLIALLYFTVTITYPQVLLTLFVNLIECVYICCALNVSYPQDTRPLEEYQVSHLPGAVQIDPHEEAPSLERLGISPDAKGELWYKKLSQ